MKLRAWQEALGHEMQSRLGPFLDDPLKDADWTRRREIEAFYMKGRVSPGYGLRKALADTLCAERGKSWHDYFGLFEDLPDGSVETVGAVSAPEFLGLIRPLSLYLPERLKMTFRVKDAGGGCKWQIALTGKNKKPKKGWLSEDEVFAGMLAHLKEQKA
ncbi:MAG: hypothetical protein J6Y62_00885 [Clostridia bacterium]|nr:hypothetical protein [Clostridia bacterium]